MQWATRMGGINTLNNPHNLQPIQGDREQFDPEALVEELRQEEEDRINAEMDAEEAELEAYQRAMEASIESEPNNSEEE